jgi:pimeloyl-ACP methyl ester carboxylesterase
MDVEEGWVDAGGVGLHYLHAGSGDPVVLLHGGIVDAASLSWGGVIEPLAEEFGVYAPDMAGYGESDRPDAPYTTTYHASVVEDALGSLGLSSASVVGLSMGGGVALALALETELVDRLVLVDSYGLGRELPNGLASYVLAQVPALNRLSLAALARSRRLTRASLGNVVEDPDAVPDEVVDELFGLLQHPEAGKAFRQWRKHEVTRQGYRTCYLDRLGEVDVPTLLVHGAEDDVFPVEWAHRAAEALPDARVAVFEGCAHWPPRERPERFVDTTQVFLRG